MQSIRLSLCSIVFFVLSVVSFISFEDWRFQTHFWTKLQVVRVFNFFLSCNEKMSSSRIFMPLYFWVFSQNINLIFSESQIKFIYVSVISYSN